MCPGEERKHDLAFKRTEAEPLGGGEGQQVDHTPLDQQVYQHGNVNGISVHV